MHLEPRRQIKDLKACHHGGLNYAELRACGINPGEVADFSVNSNPFAPPTALSTLLAGVAIDRYPDNESTELRECLSERLGTSPGEILVGNGSVELIRLVALTYLGEGDRALILGPTFGEYELACRIVGAEPLFHLGSASADFAPDVEEVVHILRQHHSKVVFICNPNSPTGHYLSREQIERILEVAETSLVILDEAFVAFVDQSWQSIDLASRANVVVLRSMTKDYALAGLRLGYAIASEEIVDTLQKSRLPWSVNVVAQKAGVIVLQDKEYLEHCMEGIRQSKEFMTKELRLAGFQLVPSKANFFMVRVGDGGRFRKALLKHNLLVRDCASFGLPEYVRIAARTMPECERLVSVVQALRAAGELEAFV